MKSKRQENTITRHIIHQYNARSEIRYPGWTAARARHTQRLREANSAKTMACKSGQKAKTLHTRHIPQLTLDHHSPEQPNGSVTRDLYRFRNFGNSIVSRVRHVEGWFYHCFTTELFIIPPLSGSKDLVLSLLSHIRIPCMFVAQQNFNLQE